MTVSLTSPVTGSTMSQFTSPTYTVVQDTAPDINGKQWAVTALGGTQTGVTSNSVASPLTFTAFRPKVLKVLSVVDPVTGLLRSIPRNDYTFIGRKGALPLAGQVPAVSTAKLVISVPAGTDLTSPAEIRALICFFFGVLAQQSQGIADTCVTGIF